MKNVPLSVAIATNAARGKRAHRVHTRKRLVEDFGIAPKTKHSKLEGVPTIPLPRLAEPYPPPLHDIYETEEIAAIWHNHRANKKHPDSHGRSAGKWPKLEQLNKDKLAHTVEVNESAIIRDDKSGKVVAVVLRNFVRDEEILEWVTSLACENVGVRRNVRVCVTIEATEGY